MLFSLIVKVSMCQNLTLNSKETFDSGLCMIRSGILKAELLEDRKLYDCFLTKTKLRLSFVWRQHLSTLSLF